MSGNEVTAWMRAGGRGRGEGTVNKNSEWEERMGFIDGPDTQIQRGRNSLCWREEILWFVSSNKGRKRVSFKNRSGAAFRCNLVLV